MRITTGIPAVLLAMAIGTGGCKKYQEASPIKNAAYIRVFNDIASSPDFLHAGATPFLAFIMDPHLDAAGSPDTGLVLGDFLGTRQLFSQSYPINEGNSTTSQNLQNIGGGLSYVQQTVNFEYPGNAHVPAAPAMNGFDMSAWAQVPSGKHRFLFVLRPQNTTPFTKLSAAIRNDILIDTTIDLQAGEVYTLEAVSTDLDNNRYGLYARQEQFIHQSFAPNQLYVGFVNLSGVTPLSARYGYTSDFPDTAAIFYSYLYYVDQIGSTPFNPPGTYLPLDGYNNNYYTTLTQRMSTQINYLSLPMLDRGAFFIQDSLRQYAHDFAPQNGKYTPGTFPYVQFTITGQDSLNFQNTGAANSFTLSCAANPVTFNENVPTEGLTLHFCPNLDLITNVGGQVSIYPSLNIMEMVYDRVYMTQIQYAFNQNPNQ